MTTFVYIFRTRIFVTFLVMILAQLPAILIAISIHEYGHAIVAYWLGDDTAKNAGRLSIDPMKHIDIFGFIMLMIAHFGWAKPVPVDFSKFKKTRLSMFCVSIAGPVFNIITAIVFYYILKFEIEYLNMFALNTIFGLILNMNIAFAAFNLIPLPPLDGSKLVLSCLPMNIHHFYYKYEWMGSIMLMMLIFFNQIDFLINPMLKFVINIVNLFVV